MIATVFKGVINRMITGYLLRDVINKVERHPLHLQRGDPHPRPSLRVHAQGDAGCGRRFRRVLHAPARGPLHGRGHRPAAWAKTILDPACGTGGFLVESFNHLEKQCKTVEDRKVFQKKSIFGGEAKPLPYMLAQMNLLLHGLESPQIDPRQQLWPSS